MLYYKCTTNGGNMRVQKFAPQLIERIVRNWPNGYCRNLLHTIRDAYILSDDKVVSITQEFTDRTQQKYGKKLTAKVEIEDKEEGLDIICSIEDHNQRTEKPSIETTVFSIKNREVSKTTTTVKVEKIH